MTLLHQNPQGNLEDDTGKMKKSCPPAFLELILGDLLRVGSKFTVSKGLCLQFVTSVNMLAGVCSLGLGLFHGLGVLMLQHTHILDNSMPPFTAIFCF